jgi:hypothetical protein
VNNFYQWGKINSQQSWLVFVSGAVLPAFIQVNIAWLLLSGESADRGVADGVKVAQ